MLSNNRSESECLITSIPLLASYLQKKKILFVFILWIHSRYTKRDKNIKVVIECLKRKNGVDPSLHFSKFIFLFPYIFRISL